MSKRILLVEDDHTAGDALTYLLRRKGCEVAQVHGGEEALKEAARVKPDVILLDLKLAGAMDGYDVMRQLDQDPALTKVPVLIVTNYGMAQDVQKGLAAGAKEYLVKSDHSIQRIAEIAIRYAEASAKED